MRQSQSFTVVASDVAGNSSEQVVTVAVNNLDEVAPTIDSGDSGAAVDENSGADQGVYTATASDDADTSDGFSFSLADESLGFSIDAESGVVTTNADFAANYEDAQSQSFTVVATDVAGNASEQVVTIAVNNLDEIAPSITSGDSAGAIDENTGAGSVIYTATANDSLDEASAGVTFSLAAGHDAALSINANGEVILASDADYETQSEYSFTVIASDGVNADVEQPVTLTVNNLDEVAPTIDSGASAAINENSGAGSVIYKAIADDSLDISAGVTYSLGAGSDAGLSINADGEVILASEADYETKFSYSFIVVASDGVNANVEQPVTVNINNLDEVAPTITSGDSAGAIDENSGAGSVIYTATADDSQDTSAGVTFSLSNDSDAGLSIDASTGAVTLASNADYETNQSISFTVVASDAVNPAIEQSVTLTVNNLDEVAPSIDSGGTGTSVDENSGAGQVVYTANATDTDANVEGITFSLVDESLGFSIDAESGVVTTNADFAANYEDAQSQSFTVVASDVAGNASVQVVTVAVNNLDEVAPTITSDASDAVAVNENSDAGQVVYTANATDTDANVEGITFSLADDSLGFSIDENGVVTTDADFAADFEVAESQSFTVVATDVAGNASEQLVTVAVNNLDEVAPTIRSGGSIVLDENTGAEQVIYKASADDSGDISEGLSFSLTDNTNYTASSGSVTSTVIIPELAAATQHVYVSESTKSEDGSQETVVVTYNADAVNTGLGLRIHFDSSAVSVASLEDVLPGSIFANSTATADTDNFDGDASTDSYIDMAWASLFGGWPGTTPTNLATVTFDIAEGASGSSAINFSSSSNASGFEFAPENHALALPVESQLSIDAGTGKVTLNVDPDFEAVSSYSFDIFATDTQGNKSEAKAVTLGINNFDDTAPLITSDAVANVDENTGADQVVYTATATDDADTSDGFTFSLADDTLGFSIDENGVVTTNADFAANYEDAQSQSFTVVASDVAGNSSEQVVTVAVNNLDEVAPSIDSDVSDAIAVDENSGAGQVVYTANATDDADTSDGFSFSLLNEGLGFSIDAESGVVTTNADFAADYEDAQSQSFTVVATDAAGYLSDQLVTVSVNDLDDNSPEFKSSLVQSSVTEGLDNSVYQATVTDVDTNLEDITYSIQPIEVFQYKEGDIDQEFTFIEDDNGETYWQLNLTFNEDLHDTYHNYLVALTFGLNYQHHEIEIVGISLSADAEREYSYVNIPTDGTMQFSLIFDNPNDSESGPYQGHGPLIALKFNLKEGVSLAQFEINQIGLTRVSDQPGQPDISNQGISSIYHLSDNQGLNIDASSGDVTIASGIDRESNAFYHFVVLAEDGTNEQTEQQVTVAIGDIDDTDPEITSGGNATVAELAEVSSTVYEASVWDADGSSVDFSLADEALGFSIDATTGVVTTNADFAADFETAPNQSITVIATDNAGNTSDQLVTVEISNSDESAPVITNDIDSITVSEDAETFFVDIDAVNLNDGEVTTPITYAINPYSGIGKYLAIDNFSGEISFKNLADLYYNMKIAADSNDYIDYSDQNGLVVVVPVLVFDAQNTTDYNFNLIISQALPQEPNLQQNIDDPSSFTVSNIKLGAIWEYSTDNGAEWVLGSNFSDAESATFTIDTDGDYQILVRQETAAGIVQMASALHVSIQTTEIQQITADSTLNEIILTFNSELDETPPNTADFTIVQGGQTLDVQSVEISSANVVLTLSSLGEGSLQVTYEPTSQPIQDLAGNAAAGFTQMVVSDGYIRDAQVYADDNNNGIADENELIEGVTSDALGQLIITGDYGDAPIIIKGGVNVDTGAINVFELTAPAGYSVINPLSTMVQEIIASDETETLTLDQAETMLSDALGITLGEGEELSSYDPISDESENAVANRVVTTQIATVLAVAAAADESNNSGDSNIQTAVLGNLVNLVKNASGPVSLDSSALPGILSVDGNGDSLVSSSDLIALAAAVNTMEGIKSSAEADVGTVDVPSLLAEIVVAQAAAIDSIRPAAPDLQLTPESNSGVSNTDTVTNDTSPSIVVSFETTKTDGTAVIAGDTLELFNNGIAIPGSSYELQQSDIDSGSYTAQLSDLADGSEITAQIIDIARNIGDLSVSISIDTTIPEFTSADTVAAIDENSGAQVIYTATVDGDDLWKFELIEGSDSALTIDESTGEVSITASADYETQSQYSFTVIATDAAGNESVPQLVTLDINNLDEVAPTITSSAGVTDIEENTGAGQVVYTATADDSQDISAGVTFSLSSDSDAALSIDTSKGVVTLADDPDFETQEQYSFTVIASDGVNQDAQQSLTLSITDVDDTAPVITSLDHALVDENIGAGELVYTVTTDDTGPVSYELISVLQIEEGAIDQRYIDNADGSITLQLFVDESIAANYAGGLANYDLLITYNDQEITDPVVSIQNFNMNIANDLTPGEITVASVSSTDSVDISQNPLLELTYQLEEGVNSAEIGVLGVLLGDSNQALPDSVARYYGSQGFSIDANTGEVSIDEDPDHEVQVSYDFTVAATDAVGNQSETVTVNLSINDLDEEAPTITSVDTAAAIDENTGAGQVVYTAVADDSQDVSAGISLSLSADSDSALSFDASTGEVTLSVNPDYETQSQYSFTVIASDGVNAEAQQTVTLDINNVDEVAPTITSGDSAGSIDENSGAGQVVYTASATDSADTSDGFSFSLADESLGFSIDAESGVVTTNADFAADYEDAQSQSFIVVATDAAGYSSQQWVTVAVNNPDDSGDDAPTETEINIPELQAATQHVYVSESTKSEDGTQETVVVTYNADAGNTGLGLRIHFDSSAVSVASLDNVLAGAVFANSTPTADTSDFDGDASTDSYIDMAWASLFGGWPGTTPANLATVTFDIAEDAPDSTAINFSSSSNASGFEFAGQDQVVVLTSGAGDVIDEEAPTITSEAEAVVVDAGDTDPVIYTATAVDNGDDAAIVYSLSDNTTYASVDSGSAESTVTIPELMAATQHVYVSESTKSEDGSQETVVVTYNADAGNTGLGLRIHFDSSAVSFASLDNVLAGTVFANDTPTADTSDFDGDASTDSYIDMAWASLFGGWPGTTPANLATVTFDILEGASGSAAINFSSSSNASGFTFAPENHALALSAETAPVESQLSIDGVTGEVTLSGTLDPDVQSEYSFTVTAADAAGNSSDLAVVVDAEQPMVDAAMVVVVDGDTPATPIYQASANIDNVSYQITDLTPYPDTGSGSAESTVTIPELATVTQHVYVSESTKSEDGSQETVVVTYNADAGNTGLGLRIHFDSSAVSFASLDNVLAGTVFANDTPTADTSDFDGDASTDSYIDMAWASLFGGWPGTTPANLATVTFDILEGASGSAAINFSSSSNASGFTFAPENHALALSVEAVSAAELVIDNAAGTVSFDATVNTVVDYSFRVEGTDANGNAIGSQTVPVVVVDQIVNADASSYTGTADEDVFALADGSAEITSGAGEDEFILDPAFASATHTITDFESGVDTIHISEALLAAGYNTSDNAPTQLTSAEMSADILDLVNGDDSSLDNLFGATYDEDSNTLTVFADSDSSAGSTDMDSFQITLDDSATVEDEDIVVNLSAFIA
jgi:hypothetical protein